MRAAEKVPSFEGRRSAIDLQPRALQSDKDLVIAGADGFTIFDYWLLLRNRVGAIVLMTLIAALATLVLTSLGLKRYYRAFATIRPIAEHAELGSLERNLPGFVDYSAAISFSPFSAESERAQEYMSILHSYDFTTELVAQHQLSAWIDADITGGWFSRRNPISDWDRYNGLKERFQSKYDLVTGSLEISLVDQNPELAKQILRYYLDGLREKLRQEEMSAARAAVASLTAESRASADPFLNSQLTELISRQIQREKLAQVEADFAFKVIDSPVVPNRPYSPRPVVDSLAAGVIVLLTTTSWILLSDLLRRYSRLRRPSQS